MESLTKQGSVVSGDISLEKIKQKMQPGSMGRLLKRVLSHHGVDLETLLKVYEGFVYLSLRCGCEAWTLYRRPLNQLEKFHQRALRSVLCIQQQYWVLNTDFFDKSSLDLSRQWSCRLNCVSLAV
ncbi:hypothetical protein ElyMa_003528000 [Elysia marginata]|uniref:Uncharacterized protein n=1 Tax=Elysia marginata TaxID=1093978 RepID=A0AAV4EIM9_9GAST|nr:hypothetical protein ElyMa_003528000 [Elysia marginata]